MRGRKGEREREREIEQILVGRSFAACVVDTDLPLDKVIHRGLQLRQRYQSITWHSNGSLGIPMDYLLGLLGSKKLSGASGPH